MAFQKATKFASKLRMAINGPSGSGKTWTALCLATALAGDGGVAVIDTEHGSASKYADIFNFDVDNLDQHSPEAFVAAINEAERAGYAVLVIDSISHEWMGNGGVLEIVDTAAKRMKSHNTFNAWGEGTPKHNRFIDAIVRSKLHIICTMRSKEEYVQERNGDRTVIRKVGLAPIQRDGIIYEFDIVGDLDHEHNMIISKSRCSALADAVIPHPDGSLAATIRSWLDGELPPVRLVSKDKLNELFVRGKKAGCFTTVQEFGEFVKNELDLDVAIEPRLLTEEQGMDLEAVIFQRERHSA